MNQSLVKRKLPNGWVRSNLVDCVEILDHRRIPINANQRKQRVGPIPYYGATGQVGWIDDYLFNEELVLLGEDGAPFLDLFKNKAYMISGKSWVNNHAHVLKGVNGILMNKFLCYYLNWFDYKEFVTGTTRLKLNQTSMKNMPILLPPLIEQKHIVTKLESIFAKIDATKNYLENVQRFLKQTRQSILKNALNGKLPSTNSKDTSKSTHKRVSLGDIIRPSTKTCDPQSSKNMKCVGLKHIESNTGKLLKYTDSKHALSTKNVFFSGDILYGRLGPYLNKVCVPNFDGVCSTDILVFSQQPSVVSKYIAYCMLTAEFVEFTKLHTSGALHQRVKYSDIARYRISLPTYTDQIRLVNKIEDAFSKIESIERHMKTTTGLFDTLKISTLNQAFDGKLILQYFRDKPTKTLLVKSRQKGDRTAPKNFRRKKRNVQ